MEEREEKKEMTLKEQIKYLINIIDDKDERTLRKLLRIVNGAAIGEKI